MAEVVKCSAEFTADLPEGFKITQLGPLPEEWDVVRLGEVAERMKAGGTPSRKEPRYWGGGVPFVLIEDLTSCGLYLRSTKERISPEGLENSSAWLVPPGSLLLSMYATIGETAVNLIPVATNQAILAIVPKPTFCAEFGAYLLKFFADELIQRNVQSTQKNVNKGIVEQFPIPLPPLPEQRAIARVLRTVQQAKEATERVIQATRELKRSLTRYLFTYGPISVEEARGVCLNEAEFGMIPSHWAVLPLAECAVVQTGVAKGRKLGGCDTVDVPYLRVANVQDGFLDLSEVKRIRIRRTEVKRYRLEPGDVLLTEGGDFDKLGRGFLWNGEIAECVHQNHIFAVRVDRSCLLPEFLTFLTQSHYGKSYFLSVAHRTTHLACINTAKLKAFPMLVPPISEQQRIVVALSSVDNKLQAEETRKQALDALFKTLLRDLMTGKIRVSDVSLPDTEEVA